MRIVPSWRRLPRHARIALDWIITLAVTVGIVLVFEAEVAQPYSIPSESMEPTLLCAKPATGCTARFSDRVIACKICFRFESPSRGQVIVFNAPQAAASECGAAGTYVKRLIGLPGDRVHEDAHGYISINGVRLAEPYVQPARRLADVTRNPGFLNRTWHVPQGSYFFMGDNRGESCDSRTWGTVPRSSVIGPVVMKYWPPDRISI